MRRLTAKAKAECFSNTYPGNPALVSLAEPKINLLAASQGLKPRAF